LKKVVKSSFNQRFIVDYLWNEIDIRSFDAIAIPGGFEEFDFYRDAYDDRFLQMIREFKNENKIVASVCVGALPVGKSGILANKKATTYNINPVRQKTLGGYGVHVVNEPIVIDDNIITSWNPSTAIEVAFALLEMLTSRENTDYIRKIMGFEEK